MTRRGPIGVRGETVLAGTGLAINAALAFGVTWMVGRAYGAESAGHFFMLTAIFMIGTSLLGLGGDTGLVRFLSQAHALRQIDRFGSYLVAATAPVVLFAVLLGGVAMVNIDRLLAAADLSEDFRPVLVGMACLLLPNTLLTVLLGASRGLGDPFAFTVLQNLFVPVARLVLIGAAVLWGGSIQLALWGWVAPPGIAAVLAGLRVWLVLRRVRATTSAEPGSLVPRSVLLREFWSFSLPRGFGIVLERGIDWADVLIVIALLGPAAGGVYGAASRIVMAGALVETGLSVVLGPRISATLALKDSHGFQAYFRQANTILIVAAWPIFLVLGIFAPHVLGLFGDEFVVGSTSLRVLCLGMLVVTAAGMLQTVLLMSGRSVWQVRNRLVQLGAMALLALLLVPVWGIVGAATAWTTGVVIDTWLAARQIRRLHGTRQELRSFLRAAIIPVIYFSGVGLVLTPVLTDDRTLGIAVGAILTIAYAAVVWLLFRLEAKKNGRAPDTSGARHPDTQPGRRRRAEAARATASSRVMSERK